MVITVATHVVVRNGIPSFRLLSYKSRYMT
jgi:hypothetical protein